MSKAVGWAKNNPVPFLGIIAFIVFLPGFHVLRIVQDDWSIVFWEFAKLSELPTWDAFTRIFTNQWYPHPRIYWISWTLNWLFHGLTREIFGLWGPGHFLPILALHFLTTTLVYKALRDALEDQRLALVAATLCLIYPTASAALFMITNWFFVIPVLFVALLVNLARNPLRNSAFDLTVLTITTLVGLFAGEQTIPLIYFVLLWFFLSAAAGRKKIGFEYAQIRFAVPGLVGLAALASYYPLFAKPHAAAFTHVEFAWSVLPGYFLHYLKLLILPLYPLGVFYGRFSVPPSWITAVCSVMLLLIAGFAWAHADEPAVKQDRRGLFVVLFLAAAIVMTAIPCLYGALNGYRPVPELRYMYAPGLLFAALIPITFSLALEKTLFSRWLRFRCWLFVGLTGCMGSLMIYQMREIWGTQKLVDQRVWSAIDAAITSKDRVLVAHNPDSRYLMPAWISGAASDFKCNYCIHDRLLIARGINLSSVTSERPLKSEDNVLSVVFRHGPEFSDLLNGRIDVARGSHPISD